MSEHWDKYEGLGQDSECVRFLEDAGCVELAMLDGNPIWLATTTVQMLTDVEFAALREQASALGIECAYLWLRLQEDRQRHVGLTADAVMREAQEERESVQQGVTLECRVGGPG